MKPRTFLFASVSIFSTLQAQAQLLNQSGLTGYFGFESNFTNTSGISGAVNGTALNGATAGNSGGIVGNALTVAPPTTSTSQGMTVNIGYGGTASASNLGQNFTISTWFKTDTPPTGSGSGRYFIYEGKTSFDASVGLRGDLGGVAGINDFQVFTDGSSFNVVDGVQQGTWQHVMQTYTVSGSNTLITTYLDGVKLSTVLNPTTANVTDSGINFGRARDSTNNRGFDGQLDEISLWSRSASDQEAFTIYNMGFGGYAVNAAVATRVKGDNLDNLNVNGSWTSSPAPTAADYIIFDNTYTQTGALDTGDAVSVAGLRVTNGTSLINIENTSGALTVGSLGVDMFAAGRDLTVKNLSINASQNWNIASGRTFTVGSDSALSGAHDIMKMGEGTVILGGNNTHTGITRVRAGTLELAGGSAISDSGAVLLDNVSGATLRLAANETIGSISGGGTTGGHINLQSFALTTGANNSSPTYAGNISGSGGSLIKSGTGILTISGTNTHTGGTFINAGALSIATTGALPGFSTNGSFAVASGATLAVQNAVADADISSLLGTTNFAAGSSLGFDTTAGNRTYATTLTDTSQGSLRITKLGTNTLTLSTANSHTGGTSILAGRINVSNNAALGSGAITVGVDTSYGAGYSSGGAPFLAMTSTSAATLANDIILPDPVSTRYYALQKLAASSTTGTNLELSGTISGGGANMIFQLDSATAGDSTTSFTLSGTNTLSGQIRLNRGAIILTNANSLGGANLLVQTNSNSTDGNVRFTHSFTLANNIAIGTNGNSFNTGENDIVLSGILAGTGSWGKVGGSGKLTLTNTNTATGALTLSSGTLSLGSTGSLFSTGAFFGVGGTTYVTVNTGATLETRNWSYGAGNALNELRANSASVRVDGGTIRFTETQSALRGFQVGANGATLEAATGVTYTKLAGTVGGDNIIQGVSSAGSLTLTGAGNGVIQDGIGSTGSWSASAGITKSGSGTWTLTGDNTYTGDTTVTNGTLAIGSSGSLGNTTTTIGINGTLAGGGTIGGTTTIAGIHTPGFSPGTQTFTNGLGYASGATLVWDLTANTTAGRGTNYDAINVTAGSFSLAEGALINLVFGENVDFSQSFWLSDQEWLVIDLSGTATEDDSNVFAIGTINGGVNYDPSLGSFGVLRKDGSTTADAVYLTWTAVPEPSTTLLSLFSLSGLLLRRRR